MSALQPRRWTPPAVADYGDLVTITAAAGVLGIEDGAGKAATVDVNPVAQVTVQVLP